MINELLFITVMLLSLTITLIVIKLGREWIMVIPPIFLIFANIFAPQFITVFGLVSSLAVPIYAAIFLATDIVAEHFGKKAAKRIIWIGFATQLMLVIFSQIMLKAEVLEISTSFRESLLVIFGFTPRLVLGSFIAYLISQNWDIWVFHSLKDRMNGRKLWLRNNLSTITSQFIDSTIFISIAFYGIIPQIWQLILSIWVLKVVVALVDTPFIYLSYGILGKRLPR